MGGYGDPGISFMTDPVRLGPVLGFLSYQAGGGTEIPAPGPSLDAMTLRRLKCFLFSRAGGRPDEHRRESA